MAIREASLENNRHQIIANNDRNSSSHYWSDYRGDDGSKHHREHHPRDFVVHPSSAYFRPRDETTERFPPIFRNDGSSSMTNKFWFEKANGEVISGDPLQGPSSSGKRVCQPSDDDAGPSGVDKIAHKTLNGDDIKKEDPPSDGNNVMEVGGIDRHHLQARIVSSVGTAVVSIDNVDQVYESINQIRKEEKDRRAKMLADLQKLCEAIPLTIKMANPLINFNGLPNN